MKKPRLPESKAALAIAMIVAGMTNSRDFDDLFENGDGTEVVVHIVNKIRSNDAWRRAVADWHGGQLIDGMPAAWVETFNTHGPKILL